MRHAKRVEPGTGACTRDFTRRDFLRRCAIGGGAGTLASGALFDRLSLSGDDLRRRGMSCIVLWMQGGPSQFETFDPKPEHENGGPTGVISTRVPGVQIAEHWPQVASVMDQIALIRSMTNREGNHQRATYQLHTGYVPAGGVRHPSLGAVVAKEIGPAAGDLPAFVTLGAVRRLNGLGAGLLGTQHDPFIVRQSGKAPDNVQLPVSANRYSRRLGLLGRLENELLDQGAEAAVKDHEALYGTASRLALSSELEAFDLEKEAPHLRAAYGDNDFGRGCLLARRLVEAGVTFVEVRSGGWDTHQNNFERVKNLAAQVDIGFAQLLRDLQSRGRLEKTLVVWMGEFGRTPRINPRSGRDHFPRAFNLAVAGGGVRGGQVIGATSVDGMQVRDRPVSVPDLFCSLCHGLSIDPRRENRSALGRPLKIVDGGSVVTELFG